MPRAAKSKIGPDVFTGTSTGRTPMARTRKAGVPEPLVECVEGFASEWLDLHASDEFPTRFCRAGTLLREGHPVVKAHPWAFAPARAHREPAA
jgi:hypothetical protein